MTDDWRQRCEVLDAAGTKGTVCTFDIEKYISKINGPNFEMRKTESRDGLTTLTIAGPKDSSPSVLNSPLKRHSVHSTVKFIHSFILPGLLSASSSRDIIAIEVLYFGHFLTTAFITLGFVSDDKKRIKIHPLKRNRLARLEFYPTALLVCVVFTISFKDGL